jgi:hypothetical protein
MKDKIKEIAYQVKLLDDDGWNTSNLTRDVEKYAESIIQECCTVILQNGWKNPIYRIHPEEPTEIIRYVKEHFGVN